MPRSALSIPRTALSTPRTAASRRFVLRDYQKAVDSPLNGAGVATITDTAAIQNIFATGGAICFWLYPRTLGTANTANFINKQDGAGTSGWMLRFASSLNLRLNIKFSTSGGEFRLMNLKPYCWNWFFMHYNGSSVSNIPTVYSSVDFSGLKVPSPSVSTAPVGTIVSDAGNNFLIGNSTALNRASDGILTGLKLFTGTLPSIAQINDLLYADRTPTTLTLIDTWRKGTTNFESDSGLMDGVITSPATLSTSVPIKLRTAIT